MKILDAQQAGQLDAYSIEQRGILSADLMEESARRLMAYVQRHYADRDRPIVVFAGAGNNGGDALALARLLAQSGYRALSVYLFNTRQKLSPDCEANAQRLRQECPEVGLTEIQQQFEAPQLHPDTLIVDALFGIGLNKPLSGGFASLVQFINASGCEVLSIDMPSGLTCNGANLSSPSAIVRATHTLTLGHPKLAQMLADCQPFLGQTHLLPLTLNADWDGFAHCRYAITEREEVRAMLRPRPPFGHKGTFGHTLLIAGRYGMAGAAILAARACLRAGTGKLTVHTPRRNNDLLQTAVPEAVLHHDESDLIFSSAVKADPYSAVAIGPGIGTDKQTALAFIEQASHTTACPLLIDADGINILGSHKGWVQQIPPLSIFTPHPLEMQRLGICQSDSHSVLQEALRMARQHRFYIVLKGHFTAVCTPEGNVHFNPTGNSGMATAGSGDVLTGIIAALLSQGYAQEQACRLGVYLHGLAGDIAAETIGEHSLTASDIIAHLPQAFLRLARADGADTEA